jgi:hypothetical protein
MPETGLMANEYLPGAEGVAAWAACRRLRHPLAAVVLHEVADHHQA